MNETDLLKKYRELDRDCALFSYRIGNGGEGNPELRSIFVPNRANREAAWKDWEGLNERVAALPSPDPVFRLVKHILEDFMDSLKYALNSVCHHPENHYIGLDSVVQNVSRLNHQPEECRLEELLRRFRELEEARGMILALIREQMAEEIYEAGQSGKKPEDKERRKQEAALAVKKRLGSIAGGLKETASKVQEDRGRLEAYFPGFTQEQRTSLDQAMERFVTENGQMAEKMCRISEEVAAEYAGKWQEEAEKSAPEHAGECAGDSEKSTPEHAGDREETENKTVQDLSGFDSALTEGIDRTVVMDPEEYRLLLKDQLGVSLEELLAWHREEIEKTRAEALSIAAALDIPEKTPETMTEINDLLFRYGAPCETAEEMIARANGYLKRTRTLAHEMVNLPEDEQCICVPLPECCRNTHPWGGYEGGDFRIRPFVGQMFLNQYNVPNITDGWIKMNAMHEAYPGHHVQYVRAATDKTPEVVKIGAKLVPLLEGTAIRTERTFQSVYEEDPFFPLFVAYRRHHASVRIYVDLMMFYFGATLAEAVKIYQDELGFDWITARKQVQAHQSSPGYFTCYYYGLKKLTEWEEEYNFSTKEYTELLFSPGYIGIDRFGEFLALTDEERTRYMTEFASLLR